MPAQMITTSTPVMLIALTVVHELQGHLEVGPFQQLLHGLQVVAALAADAGLVALDLGLDALGPLVADQLGDLLGVFAGYALFEGAGELEGLAGGLWFA